MRNIIAPKIMEEPEFVQALPDNFYYDFVVSFAPDSRKPMQKIKDIIKFAPDGERNYILAPPYEPMNALYKEAPSLLFRCITSAAIAELEKKRRKSPASAGQHEHLHQERAGRNLKATVLASAPRLRSRI